MIELPKHVRAPSAYEQHWIRYALGGVAAGYAATFVYRCAQTTFMAHKPFPTNETSTSFTLADDPVHAAICSAAVFRPTGRAPGKILCSSARVACVSRCTARDTMAGLFTLWQFLTPSPLFCRHSRLSGSRDMERWAGDAATGLRATYQENVLGPLAQLRDELFKTFRWAPAVASCPAHWSSATGA